VGDATVPIRNPSNILKRAVEHDHSVGCYHRLGLISARSLDLHIHVALSSPITLILAIHKMSFQLKCFCNFTFTGIVCPVHRLYEVDQGRSFYVNRVRRISPANTLKKRKIQSLTFVIQWYSMHWNTAKPIR
jgi:hypothetical protein